MESAKTLDQQTVDQQTLAKETVPLRHHGRTVAAVFLLLVVANLVHSMVTNENFQWGIVWHYLFHPEIMAGLGRTLILTVVGMAFAILLGILLAACRLS
jgi:polar amino acid transport system permease protein